MTKEIDISILRTLLHFDVEKSELKFLPRNSGYFRSNSFANAWNAKYAGKIALNTTNHHGYLGGKIKGVTYLKHRVIWAMYYEEWPKGDIDHINGDKKDNRISNLRVVSRSVNCMNRVLRSDSTSGYNGVSWNKQAKKWRALIQNEGVRKHVGYYNCITAALVARKLAEVGTEYTNRHGERKIPNED